MTTRNLNTTWRDIIFNQYKVDYEDDVPYPIRYLINIQPERKQDIWITIPTKIDLRTFKNAVRDFYVSTRDGDLNYEGEHISVTPRKTWSQRQAELEASKEEDEAGKQQEEASKEQDEGSKDQEEAKA